jgi:S1-C subfamily serine protease
MLEHLRRIIIAIAIFLAAGLLYRQWRTNHEGYGMFDLLGSTKNERLATTPTKTVTTTKLTAGDVAGLMRLSEESANLAAAVLPSVVSINTLSAQEVRNGFGFVLGYRGSPGLGSGVIVSKEGHVITNYHVIKDLAQVNGVLQIKVTTEQHKSYAAEIIGADPGLDIALIRIKGGNEEFPALAFADSDEVRTGQMVFAVGNPFGLTGTVTRGIISATQRRLSDSVSDLLQSDTVINPGNSGGPLVNVRGEIVGINVSIYSGEEKAQSWRGVGLAIPANNAKSAMQSILKHGVPEGGYLGIEVQGEPVAINSSSGASMVGAIVEMVVPGSPGANAGLKKGDVIHKFGGRNFNSTRELMLLIRQAKPGNQIPIIIVRDGQLVTLIADIEPRPPGK